MKSTKKLIKNLLCIAMAVCIILIPLTNVFASGIPTDGNKDESEIKNTIENYLVNFENEDLTTKEIKAEINRFVSQDSLLRTDSFCNLADLLLTRREIISNANSLDLKEYNKTITFDYSNMSILNNSATVDVKMTKMWQYSFYDSESGAANYYEFVLVKENDSWKIDNIIGLCRTIEDYRLVELGDEISLDEMNQYITDIELELTDYCADIIEEPIRATTAYSTSNAYNYAITYALNYNTAYSSFAPKDCTNFTSQCLYAGGKSMDYGVPLTNNCWFYTSYYIRSTSWTACADFRSYITSSNSQLNMSVSDWYNVWIGDIIQMDNSSSVPWHNIFVSGVVYNGSGRSDLLICAHTNDRLNVSFAAYFSGPRTYFHVN